MNVATNLNLMTTHEADNKPPSTLENNTVYKWLLRSTFSTAARAHMVHNLAPHLLALVRPGDQILDLCCGSGPMSFWFEEQGAEVTAVDFAPYMLAQAREEALHRGSSVRFIEADILAYDFGRERYDLISCFGNSISDFPMTSFAELVRSVSCALKPYGRFLLEYHDGCYEFMLDKGAREGVYQETPERITFRFETYLPEIGGIVKAIHNETRGIAYRRKGYIYTAPSVRIVVSSALALERHTTLAEAHYLDVFVRGASRRGFAV